MYSLIFAWIYGWVNNREAGDLRRHRAHYDVIVMIYIYVSIYHMYNIKPPLPPPPPEKKIDKK